MQHYILSTFESCIAPVQLKLCDFISGISTFKEGIISRLSDTKKRNINEFSELALNVGNRFELKNPICPTCGSSKVIRQEYYPRNLKLAEFGQQTIYVRRYFCKACKKKFTTPLNVIVEKGHQYARFIKNTYKRAIKQVTVPAGTWKE